MNYYEVSLNIDIPMKFIYSHEDLLSINRRCIVEFSKSIRTGIIVKKVDNINLEIDYKPIVEIVDSEDILSPELWRLSFWISDYYRCSLGKAMFSMLPKGISVEVQSELRLKSEKELIKVFPELYEAIKNGEWFKVPKLRVEIGKQLTFSRLETLEKDNLIEIKRYYDSKVKVKKANYIFFQEIVEVPKLSNKQSEAYYHLLEMDSIIPLTSIAKKFSYSILRALQMKKLIKIIPLEVNEHITLLPVRKPRKIVELTHEQSKVIDDIDAVINQYMVHLLYGITGSGKTEIYIRIMEKVLASGKNALLLVPEISLTPQAVDRFNSAFGEAIAILHSHLSDRERLQEWKRINGGECRIVIGARSAIFAPLTDLGLIIVDEEHEGSYKQDNTPRYNARDLAVIRGKLTNAPVILGSATPSLESWNNALSGKYKLHKLLKRPAGITLPEVYIIDLKKHKGDILLSEELLKAMKDRLLKKEQIILFQNRRGYSSFLQCKSCGELITCPNCDISMHYHNYTQEVTCHYCGYKKDVPRKCPSCDSYSFLYGAGGTQKLEEQVRGLFPTAKVLRMDSDTTTKKQSYSDMFEAMSEGAIDILIGTQMISKGLDFPNVTLVGVVLADISLNLPDFRAGEKTFQLLTQVAGRAGRGDKRGEVYIQTYMPKHYAVENAARQDFLSMAKQELGMRKALNYPPHYKIARILFSHKKEENLIKLFNTNSNVFSDLSSIFSSKELMLLGPTPAPLPKINRNFRYHIILKGRDVSVISSAVKFIRENLKISSTIKMAIDIDPTSLL